jgi:required for meiotic nuclear division protein 1
MPDVSVNAYGFAGTFKLRELIAIFPPGVARVEKDRLIGVFGDGRWALAYDFGALVFVGVEAGDQVTIVHALSRKLGGEPHPPLTESFVIQVEPGVPQEVRFDRVVTGELTLGVVEIVCEMLAQSVAMDYYAQDVAEVEEATDRIADRLRTAGRIPQNIRSLTQFIGLCIATRNDVVSTLALFDKPDATWENEQLDRLWQALRKVLEIDDRYRALEAKLRLFQDNLVVLVDLSRQRHTLFLELTVAGLILVEMLLMVWQILHATSH